ncbi:RNA polymerase sigma factor [Janthinobacterium violaceinigrum]|uniref:Sigma-70 family RNA polymerase sigma factor n=1 Tax=Janthinobacterium violaceinigrum TaxID=2654252 RepID=A0A6I1HYY8_9BURK|nr:sigma-70 family RNA polymerase sigma factor [Janthinobacterium violaceinigrum]KAB8063825.1 sigma-70 family RNA polymerase sigma factor [Janthinobacterium violaceinigrum]
MAGDAITAVEHVFRQERGRVLAGLMGRFGDLGLAEDVLQEACRKALELWPQAGIPSNPAAWLSAVARNAGLDHVRRAGKSVTEAEAVLARLPAAMVDETQAIEDDRLRLLFICCHPALAPEAQVALALRTLCGLSTAEIARAFGLAETALSQRVLRAKRKIAEARIPFELPPAQDWPQRLAQVQHVIYLVFSEGYCASGGDSLLRADLCAEALRLARLLDSLQPGQPEVQGLLALLLLQASRGPARLSPEGDLLTLEEQDRRLWHGDLIAEGLSVLAQALPARAPGPYQLQAAIAALHARAVTASQTDWRQISALYGALLRHKPEPLILLNAVIACAMAHGAEHGLAWLDRLETVPSLANSHYLHAARADLLRRQGDRAGALAAYAQAAMLAANTVERQYLLRRHGEMRLPLV